MIVLRRPKAIAMAVPEDTVMHSQLMDFRI
jgi:hypothetical protein